MKRTLFFLLFSLLLPLSASSQWKELNNGLYGGPIIFLQSIDNKIFAGTFGGVYLSKDNGSSWTLIYESYLEWNVNSLLAFNKELYLSINNGKTFKSADDGISWTEIMFGDNTTIIQMAAAGNKIFAVSNQGLLFTIDPGTLVTKRVEGFTDARKVTATPTKIFLGTNNNGLLVSSDGGATWTNDSRISGSLLEVDSDHSVVLVVSGATSWLSLDNGANWKKVNIELPERTGVHVEGNAIFIGGQYRALVSKDNGLTWTPVPGLPGLSFVTKTPSGIFAGNQNGVYRSTDGASWIESNYGITSAQSSTVVSVGNYLFTTNGNRVYATNNGTWQNCHLPTLPEEIIYSLVTSGGNVLAATFDSGVYLSNDKGKTWSKIPGLAGAGAMAVDGDKVYAGNLKGIYRSNDNGQTWSVFTTTIQSSFAMARLNGYLYVSSIRSTFSSGEDVTRFDDSGTGTLLDNGIPPNTSTSSFAAIGDMVFCSPNVSEIFTLDPITQTWVKKGPLVYGGYDNLAASGDLLYTYNFIEGVKVSSDKGETWKNISEGLPHRVVQTMLMRKALKILSGEIYLATVTAGVWTTSQVGMPPTAVYSYGAKLPNFTIDVSHPPANNTAPFAENFIDVDNPPSGVNLITGTEPKASETKFALFPNPASNQINVAMDLKPGTRVEIEVVNLDGQVFAREVFSRAPFRLSTEAYPPGIYFVRTKIEGGVYLGKFVKK